MVEFPTEKANIAYIIAITGSSISFVGSLFVAISCCKFPELRQFPYRLVGWLAVADVGCALSFFLGSGAESYSVRCDLQGMMFIYFNMASVFLAVGIAYALRQMLAFRNFETARNSEPVLYMLCWGVPFFLALLPLTTKDYVDTGAWCSIGGNRFRDVELDKVDTGTMWEMVCFDVPLWLSILYIFWAYWEVYRVIRGLRGAAAYHEELEEETKEEVVKRPKSESEEFTRRMVFYPLVLVFFYSFCTVNKIHMIITGDASFVLYALQFSFLSLSGFGDAVVYGTSRSVRLAWKQELSKTKCFGCWSYFAEENSPDPTLLLSGQAGPSFQ